MVEKGVNPMMVAIDRRPKIPTAMFSFRQAIARVFYQ